MKENNMHDFGNLPDTPTKALATHTVRVYFKTSRTVDFPARSLDNARDIAARCVSEYVWVVEDDREEFFPPTEIHKVTIVKVDSHQEQFPEYAPYTHVATSEEVDALPPHLREGVDANDVLVDRDTFQPYKVFQGVRYNLTTLK